MKQPLVQPAPEEGDKELTELVAFYEETLGFCPNSVKTMFHRPRIAYAFIEMNKAVMENKGRVTSSLKRLIGYISSRAAGCKYCQAHTIRAAERYGAEREQLEHIWDYRSHPAFSDAERAALELALRCSTVPNSMDDQTAEELRAHWNEGEIVEIMGVISLFGYLNRWNDSMGTEIETGAVESGEQWLKKDLWETGKHGYGDEFKV
nr:carboxymuconolactone decarboxylase family protein [Saprospiraceae bacterium]